MSEGGREREGERGGEGEGKRVKKRRSHTPLAAVSLRLH